MISAAMSSMKAATSDAIIFDVDQRTGFMSAQPPLARLPVFWKSWEDVLDEAREAKLQLGDKFGINVKDMETSEAWRTRVRGMAVLSVDDLITPPLLRRGHLVLTYILHFYVHSLPPNAPVLIPRPVSLPLLRISARLDIPPLLTFSDTVLYNWALKFEPTEANIPTVDNIRSQILFSALLDEEEFYLCSARIELRGVEVLELMRMTMDETFIGDGIAIQRIAEYLSTISSAIEDMKGLLLDVKKFCDPDIYYNEVRPWFRGEDSDVNKRKWVYEGVEEDPALIAPFELSGPSAGQSSMVHVLDLFLGVNHQSATPDQPSFMSRMQTYMPRNHRLFLNHLGSVPRPLRSFVMNAGDPNLLAAYNKAVLALKTFRDAHMIIVTMYIIGPARRASKVANESEVSKKPLKGTGGSDLVKFLKDTRSRTSQTTIA